MLEADAVLFMYAAGFSLQHFQSGNWAPVPAESIRHYNVYYNELQLWAGLLRWAADMNMYSFFFCWLFKQLVRNRHISEVHTVFLVFYSHDSEKSVHKHHQNSTTTQLTLTRTELDSAVFHCLLSLLLGQPYTAEIKMYIDFCRFTEPFNILQS